MAVKVIKEGKLPEPKKCTCGYCKSELEYHEPDKVRELTLKEREITSRDRDTRCYNEFIGCPVCRTKIFLGEVAILKNKC